VQYLSNYMKIIVLISDPDKHRNGFMDCTDCLIEREIKSVKYE